MIFSRLRDTFAIARLSPAEPTPKWPSGEFVSITRAADELSIVCRESSVPAGTHADRGWQCLRLEGPIPLSTTGVAAEFASILSKAGISIFIISTFDTDYLLMKGDRIDLATDALQAAGHSVRPGRV
jgi:hypothetical protein